MLAGCEAMVCSCSTLPLGVHPALFQGPRAHVEATTPITLHSLLSSSWTDPASAPHSPVLTLILVIKNGSYSRNKSLLI
jgi:hypothetical protein